MTRQETIEQLFDDIGADGIQALVNENLRRGMSVREVAQHMHIPMDNCVFFAIGFDELPHEALMILQAEIQAEQAKIQAEIDADAARMMCNAMTRYGRPCRGRPLPNGRCKNHGGLSTGTLTVEGKARSLANLKQYRQP